MGTSVGQFIGTVAGFALSFLVPGGALLWAGIGYSLGSLLDPPTIEDSPTYSGSSNTVQRGLPVSLCYGKCKIGGNIIRMNAPSEDTLRLAVAHCQGEIDSYVTYWVNNILWDDLDIVVKNGVNNLAKTSYTGTFIQTADTRFGVGAADRACAYRGLAYTAYTFNKNDQIGNTPHIEVLVQGQKCTPIGGGAAAFSRNPAVILYDFLIRVEGYLTTDLNTTEFQTLETYCDAVPTGGSLARYRFDYNFDTDISINDAKKLIWSSFHGCTVFDQGEIKPVFDKAKSATHSFTLDNIVKGSFSWNQKKSYNTIEVEYINSNNEYTKTTVGIKDRRDIAINGERKLKQTCHFITDNEIATRRAQFLFDKYKYTNYQCELTGLPDSQDVELFDVVEVTHTLPGWTTKDFIVTRKSEDDFGRPKFTLDAYYAAVYHDREAEDQTGYDSDLSNPFAQPDSCTSLSLTENSYLNYDGKHVPTLDLTYTPPDDKIFWDHVDIYLTTQRDGGTYRFYGSDFSDGVSFTIDASKANFNMRDTVTVRVVSVKINGIEEDHATAPTASELIDGQASNPNAPTGLGLIRATGSSSGNTGTPYVWSGINFTAVWRIASQTGGWGRETFGQELQNFGGVGTDEYWLLDVIEIWTGGVRRFVTNTREGIWKYIFGDDLDVFLDKYIKDANGTVVLKVKRLSIYGAHSEYTTMTITHASPTMASVTGEFMDEDCILSWAESGDPSFWKYKVEVYSDSGRANLIRTEWTRNSIFAYTYEMNYEDMSGSPIDTIYFTITIYNVFSQTASTNVTAIISKSITVTGLSLAATFAGFRTTWTKSGDRAAYGYNVYIDTTSPPTTLVGFTTDDYFVYNGDPSQIYYVKVSTIDRFGNILGTTSVSNVTTNQLPAASYNIDIPLTTGITWSTSSKAAWTTGSLIYDGIVYTIAADNTTDAYIYWNKNSSPTTFLHSASRPALGADIWLMAYYDSVADEVYPAMQNKIIHAGVLQANSITANEIAAGTITGTEITGTTLSAIYADLGTITAGNITIDASGYIRGGQTGYDTGTGFWLGYDATAYKFSLGNPAAENLTWDGSALTIEGTIQTAASGQRVAITSSDNTIKFYDASGVVITLDDNVYDSKPGMRLDNGIIYNYKDAANFSYQIAGEYWSQSDEATAGATIKNANVPNYDTPAIFASFATSATSVHAKNRYGINAKSEITQVNNNDNAIGVYGFASTTGTGSIYSGYFEAGDFLTKLGDAVGVNKVYIKDSGGNEVFSINSDGDAVGKAKVITNTTNERWLQDDRFPVKMHMIRNEQMNNLLDLLDSASEELDEIDFATHAEWDVTGVADDTGGNCAFVFAAGSLNGTCQQIAIDRIITGTNSVGYQFTYTVAVAVAPDGDFTLTLDNFPVASTTLSFTAGTHTVRFMSAAAATAAAFTITGTETTSTAGSITIDNVSLKRCKDIFITAIDTGANTVTVSWLPYIEHIWSPVSGKEWALLNRVNTSGGADPSRAGNYTEIFQITSGTYSTRVLSYHATEIKGAEGNWDVGDLCMFFNMYDSNWEWPDANPIISEAGAGWRSNYVTAGSHFYHSDGSLVLLVNGQSATGYTIGAFKSTGTDWETWTVQNSDAAIFTESSSGDWRDDFIFSSGILKLPNEDRFIAYCSGKNGVKWRIGYVKFDEDFSAGSIEYSFDEILPSSGSGTSGYCAPNVIYYGGKYRMVYCDRDDGDPDADPWKVKEAFSDTPEGPFTFSATIFESSANEGIWRSSHSDIFCYFMWKGELHLFYVGTSRYLGSGTRGNRCYGVARWDEKLATPAWVENPHGPFFFSFYNDDIWPGIDDWAQDHCGGYPSMAMHPTDGKLYQFNAIEGAGDAYKIGVWKLDIQNLISETFT